MRAIAHPSQHPPILAAALIGCLAVLGGIAPGVAVPLPAAPLAVGSVARPGIALPGALEVIESGYPGCKVVGTQLVGGGAELTAVRTAFPKSRVMVGSLSATALQRARNVLVCPR